MMLSHGVVPSTCVMDLQLTGFLPIISRPDEALQYAIVWQQVVMIYSVMSEPTVSNQRLFATIGSVVSEALMQN